LIPVANPIKWVKAFVVIVHTYVFWNKKSIIWSIVGIQSKFEGEMTKIKWIKELQGNGKQVKRSI
jgi:hypothetical protein